MVAVSPSSVAIRAVADGQNDWVALLLGRPGQGMGLDGATLQALFGTPELLAAAASLACIVAVDSPLVLTPPVLDVLPPNRVWLLVPAAALAAEGAARRLADLQRDGYRVLLDGAPAGAMGPVARDCSAPALTPTPAPATLLALLGPHLAYHVDDGAAFSACETAGFTWFSGDYPLDAPLPEGDDGASRRRLLTMLALLARDADSRELEAQLKQDAALSYHLLKLVNTAAFSGGVDITSFDQAIRRLGRRQLQRWLQLLLYARAHPDAPQNLMLPIAALRGAMLEALCRHDGGDSDAQDQAFMAGVFSLLDRLFRMPMATIVAELRLPADVQAALLARAGVLGARLALVEGDAATPAMLAAAGVGADAWWDSRLHAYAWASQVARNV